MHAEGVLRVGAAVRSVAAGDVAGAGNHLLKALRLGHRRGLWYVEELAVLVLVVVATAGGCTPEAARLHGAMSPILAGLSRAIAPEAMQLYEFAIGQARTQLGEDTFERETGRGRLLTWDDASTLAAQVYDVLSTTGANGDVTPAGDHMTPRQAQVLSLLATGRTNKEIAVQLGLRPKTVMHYTSGLYRRLGVRNRTEAVAEARRLGLLSADG